MQKTLTVGKPWRVILLFALPLMLGNVVQQLYQVVDAMVVGQHLGVDALAAVGTTSGLLFLLTGFAWGTASGLAIPTAQAFGAGDYAAVRRSVAAGTVLAGAISIAITAIGTFFARDLLDLLQKEFRQEYVDAIKESNNKIVAFCTHFKIKMDAKIAIDRVNNPFPGAKLSFEALHIQ